MPRPAPRKAIEREPNGPLIVAKAASSSIEAQNQANGGASRPRRRPAASSLAAIVALSYSCEGV